MSLFIAISLPKSTLDIIDSTFHDKGIPDQLWQRGNDLHITLLFLKQGIPKEEYIQSVKERLKTISFSSFSIKIAGLEVWNKKDNYQIIHLQVEESEIIKNIQSKMANLFPERISTLPFKPHISLIRSKEISISKSEELKGKFSSFEIDKIPVDTIHLYISNKESVNNRNLYRKIESYPAN